MPVPLERRVGAAAETDSQLIQRSHADPDAFGPVFDRHWAAIRAFCTSRAGASGEDIAAEVFRLAFHKRRSFDHRSPDATPWLYGIATNQLRQHFRAAERGLRAGTRHARREPSPYAVDDALGRVEAESLGPQLAGALRTLSADDRDALLLYAWAELSYEAVAEATGAPVGTVRSRIHRARMRVQAHLTREETR